MYIKLFAGAEVSVAVYNEFNMTCSVNASVILICEGIDLEQLQWSYTPANSYNFSERVKLGEPFLADDPPQDFASTLRDNNNLAFLTVQLITVSRHYESNTTANFSSILTVDLLELEKQGISSISCGDVGTNEEKLVSDITVWDIFNTEITAVYQFGALTNIEVQLRNLVSYLQLRDT